MTDPPGGAGFPRLLAPGRIGSLELRNRILLCPMGDTLGNDDGTVSERQIAYYEARARGGAGLLLVGSVAVAYPAGTYDARQLGISDDRFLPGLRALADRVHAHGARIAAQLVHDGGNSLHDIEAGRPLLVPSPPSPPQPDRLSRMVTADEADAMLEPFRRPGAAYETKVATGQDLDAVIAAFAAAAERARRAGFDGIELHAGHGYLVDAFLSPGSNRRTDEWGGTVANRARLLLEIVRAVRDACGAELPLWCRLNAEERHRPGGETLDDAKAVAALAVAAGLDAIHVSAYADPAVAVGITDAHTPHQPGALVDLAAALKAVVPVPVIAFGRLEPAEAEQVLAAGKADFIAMGRKLLADPDLPNKLAAGRVDDVRPCIYQYRCIGNIFVRQPVACVANPDTAHEIEVRALRRPEAGDVHKPGRVWVVGGGPAGLEVSRRLAEAGRQVTLIEAATRLGGALAWAGRTDDTLDRFLGWLIRGVDRAGVDIRLGETATAALLAEEAGPCEVVVATGARWDRPSLPGADLAHVHTAAAIGPLLDGDKPLGRVAVIGGGKAGLSVAAACARRDPAASVTVLEPTRVAAPELGLPGRFRLVHDVTAGGVELVLDAAVTAITSTEVTFTTGRGDRGDRAVCADTVIVTSGRLPDTALRDALEARGLPVLAIGECRAVGGIEGAMLDAAAAARRLGPHSG